MILKEVKLFIVIQIHIKEYLVCFKKEDIRMYNCLKNKLRDK